MSSDNGRKRSHNLNEDDTVNDFENTIVGGDAWSTLDWLILLFEQDEMLAESRASGRFSNLLLQQIPPPRSGTGSRWDTAIPLRIILFCMEQTNIRRQMLGSRLMTLFINLSATPHLDLSMFVASLYSHLNAAGLEKLPALLSNLYPSTSTYRFKIMLCRKLLSDASHEQPVLLRVKFELINSYGLLQSELTAEERDSDWMSLLRDGKANKLIETVFSFDNPDSHIFREVLQSTMLIWSS
ncbi:hypothetical protein C0989_012423 [Termitomyces sp. Mn162]|nr:hypothetical protein C0989_012423 [Termitomyces sp. Mn162]